MPVNKGFVSCAGAVLGVALTLSGCVMRTSAQDVADHVSSKVSASRSAATTTRNPQAPKFAPDVTMPAYLHRKGTESGGEVEVWSAETSVFKIDSFKKKLRRDLAAAFPVGRAWNGARWCGQQDTGLGFDYQWQKPSGEVFQVQMMQSYQYFYVKLSDRSASGSMCQ